MTLELLSPARNADIGIAAINCGADAVYIAGPAFGARQAAGNSVEDIARLCVHAHRFGARVYVTVNTIIYDSELEEAGKLLVALADAGADAFIVQDLAVAELCRAKGIDLPLHASTQCAIRTPQKARFYEDLGFSRLVLERQMPPETIAAIRDSVGCELEFFVHGALCMSYSGECYLSEYLAGRSANRGACVQACRSLYDLEDASGKVLVRNKALLSLKDYCLIDHIGELAGLGICSFKIEGRLKSLSYVANVTREYSEALDTLVGNSGGRFCRASFGTVRKGFAPDMGKTFNRGYTELFFAPSREGWSSMDIPKSSGERAGVVCRITRHGTSATLLLDLEPGIRLSNGDGLCFNAPDGSVVGFRCDVCEGTTVRTRAATLPSQGTVLMRNLSVEFEKSIADNHPERLINVYVDLSVCDGVYTASAISEDGRRAEAGLRGGETARNGEWMLQVAKGQLSKRAAEFSFSIRNVDAPSDVPMASAAELNALRRTLAEKLSAQPCHALPIAKASPRPGASWTGPVAYTENVANHIAEVVYGRCGATDMDKAYELSHPAGVPLMRSAYCLRRELGLCLKQNPSARKGDLFLVNNGLRLRLGFDCSRCEMTVLNSE